MNDYQWEATARIRYCRAYCGRMHQDQHHPSCAYNNNRWMVRVKEILRKVNNSATSAA